MEDSAQTQIKQKRSISLKFASKIKMKIKPIILHHNNPENADLLYDQLSTVFDDVEILDSGSDPHFIPENVTMTYPNIYWTGAWNEAIKKFSDYDVIWMLGCDIELKDSPDKYRESIERSMPFGCWSPAIEGRCHSFMSHEHYNGESKSVTNIEGMSLAVSGKLAKRIGKLVEGSDIGFGQDYWMCYRSRQEGMKNIIDGGVAVFHPEGIGYNEQQAHDQMEKAFTDAFGSDFRKTIFNYSPDFRGNLLEEVVTVAEEKRIIMTVDKNGNIGEFSFLVSQMKGFCGIILEQGPSMPIKLDDIEIIKYTDDAFDDALSKAHVALFTYCDGDLEEYVKKVQAAGIPVVMNNSFANGLIDHENNGAVYGHSSWATSWLRDYGAEGEKRDGILKRMSSIPESFNEAIKDAEEGKVVDMEKALTEEPPAEEPPVEEPPKVDSLVSLDVDVKVKKSVTVITPTYKREIDIVRRCIQCLQVQTFDDWEQVICSDGIYEEHIDNLVKEYKDLPISYTHTKSRTDGDYGNTVRATMLAEAKGDYIVLLDDDNMIMPEYIEKMLNALKESNADFAICKVLHFGPLQPFVGPPPVVLTGIPPKLYYFDTLQMVCKREALQDAGWDRESGYFADGVTVERLVEKGYKYVEVAETLAVHM